MLHKNGWNKKEDGSASLEFITAGVLLLVPLVYLVLCLSTIQAATLATEAAARHANRVFIDSSDVSTAHSRAHLAAERTLKDYAISMRKSSITIQCQHPSNCLTAGNAVRIYVESAVSLPGIPPVFGLQRLATVTLASESTMIVSRFHG